jgi:predicted nucleotidyltransferase
VVQAQHIIDYVDAIAAKFRPDRVILFGSYAYGEPTEDSDVDLLVVKRMRRGRHNPTVRIRLALPFPPFPLDLLVRSQSDIERRIGWNDFFLEEVMEKGIELYAADDDRVGREGRRRLQRRLRPAAVA